MVTTTPSAERAQPRQQPYTLYAVNGRVYAQNVTQAVIDLGPLARQGGGWSYLLEGNKLAGDGFGSAQEALRHLAGRLHFLWLDGQFTALPDVRANTSLADAERLDITLDELGPNEPVVNAAV